MGALFSLDTNIPVLLSLLFICGGLYLLSKSADRFVDESATLARAFGVSPLVVGMVIIGFGTSAPELAVSALSAAAGHSDLSLGNAYGSCIFNIAGILGVAAMVRPFKVRPSATLTGVGVLLAVCAISFFLCRNMTFSRMEGIALLAAFLVIVPLYCLYDQKNTPAGDAESGEGQLQETSLKNWAMLLLSLVLLVASSHFLVWGCVDFARDVLGVSPLVIGLTIVAVGTSLPELASALASARRGEHDFIIGNIIGSNLFNMLGVVGLAGTISPFGNFSKFIMCRDLPVVSALSLMIFLFGFNFIRPKQAGTIGRVKGFVLIGIYIAYLVVMIANEFMCAAD